MKKIDLWKADLDRNLLASSRSFIKLKQTYKKGAYPDIPDLSSNELWDSHSEYSEVPDFRIRRLREVEKNISPIASILDIGVGWGEIIPMLLEKPQRKYVGLDFSAEILKNVKKKYPKINFVHGNLNKIKKKFSVVLALEVCEHIVPTKIFNFYNSVKERLSSEGIFIISVPLYENLKNITLQCPGCKKLHNRMGHVRSYTPELIKAELRLAGFKIVKTSYIYTHFENNFYGILKRTIVKMGLSILRLNNIKPLNIIVFAKVSNSKD